MQGYINQWNYTYFGNSTQNILDYISNSNYMYNSDFPGVCFGFSVFENSASDYTVEMVFDDKPQEPSA